MEDPTTKDKTPASSPSPHNLRRKQHFASEENLSSRPTKPPEEVGRTSPAQAFSGSTSLETFKSMTLPSYKLLSSEENLDTSAPPSLEAVRETKKPDTKKSALLSLVTGKKEMAAKTNDAEIIPDRTLQSQENTIPEEKKSEEEAKCPEVPADLGRGSPSGDAHHEDETVTNKQLLGPCEEEEQKPEKAAAAKTKAVKPRWVQLLAGLGWALLVAGEGWALCPGSPGLSCCCSGGLMLVLGSLTANNNPQVPPQCERRMDVGISL